MRFHGKVGYRDTVEVKPGLVEEQIVFKEYYGDVIRNAKKDYQGSKVISNIQLTNQISIVADPYALGHFFNLKCVEWQGALWSVTDVDASQPPRLILSLGGVYNENMEPTP